MMLFTTLASVIQCSILPLYDTDFEYMFWDRKRLIKENYRSQRLAESPKTFDEFTILEVGWIKGLALSAVKEYEAFSALPEEDKAQLAENLSGIQMQWIY